MYIRSEKTKNAIVEAFFACMDDKPAREITITEICQKAGLNRTTFYKHYKSTDDIIGDLEREQLNQFCNLLKTRDKFGEELINDVLNLVEENRQINAAARGKLFSDSFVREMAAIAKEYTFDDWKKSMPKATDREVELALTTMISATLQVVASEAGKNDRETVVRFISNMINGCIKMYA